MAPVPHFAILALRELLGIADRHRVGYWRDYHARNFTKRRAYLTAKAREYRKARSSITGSADLKRHLAPFYGSSPDGRSESREAAIEVFR